MRRTRQEILADNLLLDRARTLEQLLNDPATPLADKAKYHKQLASVRTKLRKRREERLRQRELRKRELAEQRARKLPDEPALELSAERPAELPPGVREIFERNATPEPAPQPQPAETVPDPVAEAARAAAAERGRRVHAIFEREWQMWNGVRFFYKLPTTGETANENCVRVQPCLRRTPRGDLVTMTGSPAVLLIAEETPAAGKRWWHGMLWAEDEYNELVEQLAGGWTLPPAPMTASEAVPVIATSPGERREMIASIMQSRRHAEAQRSQDTNRFSLGPVSGVGRLGSAGY